MFWELLIVGSFWWWIFLIGGFFFFVYLIEGAESGSSGVALLVAMVAVVQFFSNFNLLGWFWDNPLRLIVVLGVLFVGGIPWALIKWSIYVNGQRELYDEQKKKWLEPNNLKKLSNAFLKYVEGESLNERKRNKFNEWADTLNSNSRHTHDSISEELKPIWTFYNNSKEMGRIAYGVYGYDYKVVKIPDPSKHKARILRWMCWWPFSMFWTLLNDPFRFAYKWVYKRMAVIFTAIGKRAFRGVEDDFIQENVEP